MRILIVCHANTYRSPMAWALLGRALAPWEALFTVDSGGIGMHAKEGGLMSLDARLALKDAGLELSEDTFLSKDLRRHPEIVLGADLILTMTGEQKKLLLEAFANLDPSKVQTWLGFVNEEGDIEDPCGKGTEGARACLMTLQRTLPRVVEHLLELTL